MKIEARVAGSQPMIVNWYKDDKEIFSSGQYDMTFKSNMAVMAIKNTSRSDSGTYLCKVTNEAGSASCQVSAHITGAFFFSELQLFTTFANISLPLKCCESNFCKRSGYKVL